MNEKRMTTVKPLGLRRVGWVWHVLRSEEILGVKRDFERERERVCVCVCVFFVRTGRLTEGK